MPPTARGRTFAVEFAPMTLRTWALFTLTEIALCFSPGPAVLFVIGSGLRSGARRSLFANAGILSGNALYFALSAAGLGALLLASQTLFTGLTWAGAAYLIWLGVRELASGVGEQKVLTAAAPLSPRELYGRALALQLANPKNLVFFAAILPQFLDPAQSLVGQIALLGVTSLAVEFLVLGFYGYAAGTASDRLSSPRWRRRLAVVSGAVLIGAGLRLALQSFHQ
jgi:homoserine/homoserine lactone efflux protein